MREAIKQIKEAIELAGFERYNKRYYKVYRSYEFSMVFYKNFVSVHIYHLLGTPDDVGTSFETDSLDRIKASIYGITGEKL